MLTLDDVRRLAAALPEVVEGERRGTLTWSVDGKNFAWERPYTKADRKRFGDATPPPEPLVGLRTADLAEKEAVLAAGQPGVFTISHFDGYPAVLVCLRDTDEATLSELLEDSWLAKAPARLTAAYTGTGRTP